MQGCPAVKVRFGEPETQAPRRAFIRATDVAPLARPLRQANRMTRQRNYMQHPFLPWRWIGGQGVLP